MAKAESEGYQENFQTMIDNDNSSNESYIRYRFETDKLLLELKAFMEGYKLVETVNNQGNVIIQKIKIGSPKANDLGIQEVMSDLNTFINSQVVHGNLDSNHYETFMEDLHKQIAIKYVKNSYKYNIDVEDLDSIINRVVWLAELFISRTINDGERKTDPRAKTSYSFGLDNQKQKDDNK